MKININVPAIEKLVDYVASGIGGTAGHLFAGRIARREAEARLIKSRGQAEVQKALAEGQASAMQIITRAQADARSTLISPDAAVQGEIDFAELVTQRIQFQEEKRQANIGAVVREAFLELDGKEVQDHEVDHDWTTRFFGEVQDVSSEHLRTLWAKLLAGEVERPGSTSIKTLNVLKNLDKKPVDLFRRLCSISVSISVSFDAFVIHDVRVPSLGGQPGDNSLSAYGLAYGNLNVLNEHELIISDYDSWGDYNFAIEPWPGKVEEDMFVAPFGFQSRYWVLSPTKERGLDEPFKLSGVALTESGKELSRVVNLEPIPGYAQALVTFLKDKNLQLKEVSSREPYKFG